MAPVALDTHPYRVLMVHALGILGLVDEMDGEQGFDPRADGPLKAPGQHIAERLQRNFIAQNVAAKEKRKPIPFPGVKENGVLDAPMRKALDTFKPQRPTFTAAFLQIAKLDDERDGEEYYTQGAARWQGVRDVYGKIKAGEPPQLTSGDCSAGYTRWVLWALQQSLGRVPHDVVNGASWQAGFTGTIVVVCRKVAKPQIGDAILYGSSADRTTHVTGVYDVGQRTCISHGKERAEIVGWDHHTGRLGFWRPVYTQA